MRRSAIALLFLALAPGMTLGQSNPSSSTTISGGGLPNPPNAPIGGAHVNPPEGTSESKPGAPLHDFGGEANKTRLTDQDRRFVRKAVALNGAELGAARLAEKEARQGDVKLYAREVVSDDAAAQSRLESFARASKIATPRRDKQAESEITELKAAKGSTFDAAYGELARRDTKAEVALLKQEVRSGGSKALRDYARLKLQTVANQAKNAQSLKSIAFDRMNCPTTGDSKPGCS